MNLDDAGHTRKLPAMRDGDHKSPSTTTRTMLNTNSKFQRQAALRLTSPPLDLAFLHAKDEDRARFDHGPSLKVIESSSDTRNDALSCCMDDAKSIDGCFNIANKRRYIWVTCHLRA